VTGFFFSSTAGVAEEELPSWRWSMVERESGDVQAAARGVRVPVGVDPVQ